MGIKQLYNDNLRKLPNEYGDVSVMTYAVAMNMDNTDTGIAWKNRGSLQILHLAYKNGGFKTMCREPVCLCYATLHFFVIYYQSK